MRQILIVFLLITLGVGLQGQTLVEGKEGTISYVTAQNVYVKFQSTENISTGDTLFAIQDSKMIPLLIVKELSSISCVCTPITAKQLSVGDRMSTQQKIVEPKISREVPAESVIQPVSKKADTVSVQKDLKTAPKQEISGRISLSSYSNFSSVTDFSQRMRYTFSLNAQNIGDSKLSGETYISFVHKLKQWSDVQNDVFNGLKIYSLALNYAIDKRNSLWAGRKINPRLSSVGAIDGLQYETKLRSFTAGIFAGTRPDYINYSFNADLLQYGGYIGHDFVTQKGNMQSSIALVEQQNKGNTDRRFAYFQHTNSLIYNFYFFGSAEFELYNKVRVETIQDTTYQRDKKPKLSNLYISVRYKVIKQLSLSLSYSARQNIVYYETYKDIVDRLLQEATLQGYMFQVTLRPGKKISIGANAGYRYSKRDPKPSKNLYSYLTYNSLPWINATATLSATLMETSYISGSIYSLGISRDLVPGKLYGGINYRYVHYNFLNAEMPLKQNMAEMNLTWRISKKLSCSLNYEGTFEKGRNFDNIYVNLTQRF